MADRLFPILGSVVPPMLGRAAIIQRMMSSLTKSMPDHLQVVGPKFAGKTVILQELAHRLRDLGKPFSVVVFWDLGHQTPCTDEAFLQRFARELASALDQVFPDYAQHLKAAQGNPYQEIADVLDDALKNSCKILVIMDGFDKPLSKPQLTRNLWDQLRELALKPSLRLVTASRRTLRDLIRQPDAQTSDFWNIFDPSPVRVGCFDEDDLTIVLTQLENLRVTGGAKTELLNETNGFPVLLLEILNGVQENEHSGEVKSEDIVNACAKLPKPMSDIISELWRECTPSSQDLLLRVQEEQTVSRAGIPNEDAETLIERGFIHQSGNKLQRPCRLLKRFLDGQPHEGNAQARLFGSPEGYRRNFKGALERRIEHLKGIDLTLRSCLQRGAADLPEYPEIFMGLVQVILERSFTLIWQAEFGKLKIPSDWFPVWRRNNEKFYDDWLTRFPEGGQRLRLLDLMTGTQKSDRCSKYVTKNTYVLANAAQGFRDFGVHPKSENVDLGTAYAALLVCIELAASLARELPTKK